MEKKTKTFTQLVTGALICMITAISLCSSSCKKKAIPAFYKVTFDTQEGSVINPIGVKLGNFITLPDIPAKAGATFDGWFTDKECINSFSETTAINADLTLYAKWIEQFYTVTFDLNEKDNLTINPINGIKYGNKIAFLPKPERKNYLFDGWYANKEANGIPFSPTTPITDNITLYAKWVESNAFKLLSRSLDDGEEIPAKHTRNYGNVTPHLGWINAPKKTKSFLIIMDTYYPHDPQESLWTVYDIPAHRCSLEENDPWLPRSPILNEIRYSGPFKSNTIRLTIYALKVKPGYFNYSNYPKYAKDAEKILGDRILASDYYILYHNVKKQEKN